MCRGPAPAGALGRRLRIQSPSRLSPPPPPAAVPPRFLRSPYSVLQRFASPSVSLGLAAVALCCAALIGCGDGEDPIAVYTAPAVPEGGAAPVAATSDPVVPPFAGGMTGVQTPDEPQRLLGAITLGESGDRRVFWFFKFNGPVAAVEAAEPGFRQWLKSISLSGEEPTWTVPDGWTERPGGGMRYATLLAPDGTEATVTTFGVRGSVTDQIEANLSRWRGQVGASGDAGTTEEVTLADGVPALLLSVSTPDPNAGTETEAPGQPQADALPFEYETPEGWREVPSSPMSTLEFSAWAAGVPARVTISEFPAGAISAEQVAGIWREQEGTAAGVPPADAAPLKVGGANAVRIGLPPQEPGGSVVLGAALTRGETLWLFKLFGDEDSVAYATPAFEAFLADLRFLDEQPAQEPPADEPTDPEPADSASTEGESTDAESTDAESTDAELADADAIDGGASDTPNEGE